MDETTEPTREKIAQWMHRTQDGHDVTLTHAHSVAVFRMALRTLDAEEELDRARKLHASFPGSPLASEVIDGQARRLEEMEAKLTVMTAQSESYKTMALSAARRVRDIHAIVCGEDDSLSPREQHEAIVDVLRGHHALGPWTAAEADLARKIASDPCVVSKRWPGGRVEHARIVGEEAERAERSHRTLCGDSAQFLMRKAIPWIAAMTERADRLQRHFDEAAPEHNLPALLDLYAERERAATERAEKAERLSATLRAVAEQEVADAIVKSRERATRVGWIDHATGDYEERAVTMLMDDLAAGSAVCAFLRMVGVWTLEDRAETAEREQDEATKRAEKSERDWYEAFDRGRAKGREDVASAERDAMRARLAEVERERDEALSANDRITAMVGEVNELFVGYDDPVAAVRALIDDYRAATTARERLREALADARAKLASATQDAPAPTKDERLYALAESPTTHTRCEVIFQRKRADWWRSEAKRLGWTPDYPELREEQTSDSRLDCESSSLLLLSTWARKVMMREKNRDKGVPCESVWMLLGMAREELFEASDAIYSKAPTDDILAELGDAAAIIGFAMREIEKRRNA